MIRNCGLLVACLIVTTFSFGSGRKPAARRHGEFLVVELPLGPGAGPLSANEQLTVTPVVENGGQRVQLAPVVWTGRIRQKVNERRERLYGIPAADEMAYRQVVVRPRRKQREERLLYVGQVPYRAWMAGGRVVLERQLSGCAGHTVQLPTLTVATIPAAVRARLEFLVPATEPDKRRCEQLTAVVHFPQGRSVLLRNFADNRRELARIDSLTERLLTTDSLTIEHIYLKGYASPEDTYAFNTRLSANRVLSLRGYLEEHFGLNGTPFRTATEPEDWDSLRRWIVKSDLPVRDNVLAAIDATPDPDARDAAIWQIDQGKTYLALLREVYPQLRRVDYRIGYLLPAFTVEQTRELIASRPEWLSVGELCRLAETYPLDSPECAYVCAVALEYYPDDPCACNNMATLALRRGDVQTARQCLDCVADNPLVQNNLGVLCLIDGDREKARHCFTLAARNGSEEGAYNLEHLDDLYAFGPIAQ